MGKSAVAAAAYRSGEKMVNEWDGLTHDFTRKGGIVHTEIMLPIHAPPEFADRSTLWNSVEEIEKASVPGCTPAGNGERTGYGTGVQKKSKDIEFRCRK